MKQMKMQNSQSATSTIKSILVEDLFGTYSYELTPLPKQIGDDSLFLLYGENGAGKSTILKLLFHILNPEPYAGHRSFITTIPFKTFEIRLNSGATIAVKKDEPFSTSDYSLIIQSKVPDVDLKWGWDAQAKIKPDPLYDQICNFLKCHGPGLFFLPDNRKIEGAPLQPQDPRIATWEQQVLLHSASVPAQDSLENLTAEAVSRMAAWFRQQALSDTNTGYTSVNTIYVDLLTTIVGKRRSHADEPGLSLNTLRDRLHSLNVRNAQFSKYGLTPELDIDKLSSLLAKAKPDDSPLLATVLKPYLDGHNARLDALARTQQTIDQFVSTIADFFVEKTLSFGLGQGVCIKSSIGRDLRPEFLSSGEKQLLLLFCNAITARNDGTIFIIDEPEISLNVKWQRRLLKSLLTCLSGVKAQVILATHSIEILSQYEEFVTPLQNKKRKK
jgi:energy-coupling factor transporter ATP-binding protein EcfA2